MQSDARRANVKIGLWLFLVYSLFYVGFVLVNAFAPEWSETIVYAGLNLALVWGFSLIGLAFILAMIYGVACQTELEPTVTGSNDVAQSGSASESQSEAN